MGPCSRQSGSQASSDKQKHIREDHPLHQALFRNSGRDPRPHYTSKARNINKNKGIAPLQCWINPFFCGKSCNFYRISNMNPLLSQPRSRGQVVTRNGSPQNLKIWTNHDPKCFKTRQVQHFRGHIFCSCFCLVCGGWGFQKESPTLGVSLDAHQMLTSQICAPGPARSLKKVRRGRSTHQRCFQL